MAATATATEVSRICSSMSLRHLRRLNPIGHCSLARFSVGVPILFRTTSFKSSVLVRASEPQREEVTSSTNDPDRAFTSQEDLSYLWKLGAGSIVGAAAIKYGSIIFPAITRPNILEALIMISAPVIVAVLLLIRQSRLQQ